MLNKLFFLRAAVAALAFTSVASSAQAQYRIPEPLPRAPAPRPRPRPIPIPLPLPLPLPQDNCPNQLEDLGDEISTSFSKGIGKIGLSLDPTLGAQAVADCEKIGFTLYAKVKAKLLGGLIEQEPLDVDLNVYAKEGGENRVELVVSSFGKELWSEPLVQQSGRLKGKKNIDLALPVNTDGSWDDSTTITIPFIDKKVDVAYDIDWEVVSIGGALVRWDLSNTKAFGSVWASANMDAQFSADLTANGASFSKTVPFDVYWAALGAHGLVGLDGGTWRASGAGSATVRGLEGRLRLSLDDLGIDSSFFPSWVPSHYDVYNLPGVFWGKDLTLVDTTFDKAF